MHEYELIIEDMNPCGGTEYANRSILEVETDSPEAYVRANARMPILSIETDAEGSIVITTGNNAGYIVRYTFSE